jgi:acyl-CoA synthetase (AMP-forming)/AMP-acid ligase II
MNIGDCIRMHAKNRPNKAAIHEGEVHLTYREMNGRVNRLANGLLSLGVEKGDVVAIVLPDCHEHLEALFALGKIGVISLPIDIRLEPGEVERTLNYFDASAVIFFPEKLKTFQEFQEKLVKIGKRLICTRGGETHGVIGYEELIERSSPKEPEMTADEHDPLLIGLSSGTTGPIKGALLSHRNLMFRWLGQIVEFNFNASDVFLNVAPIQYSAGRSFAMSHFFFGATVMILGGRFDPLTTLKTIEQERITTCFMVPTMYHRIIQLPELDKTDTTCLRALVSSGAMLHPTILREVFERFTPNLYNYFGSIEGGGVSILKPQDMLRKGGSVGQGIFNSEIRIVDEEGIEVPSGTTGEILVRGPAIAQGYYGNPDATKEYFPDGWCRMGDLGRLDDEGFLFLEGRKKDMIIRGGVNIYPVEIEETLQSHPSVDESAVVGLPSQEYGEEIAAFIVLKPGKTASREELVRHCETRLAPYKKPKMVEFVPSLPKTPSGKVLKIKLRGEYQKRSSPAK